MGANYGGDLLRINPYFYGYTVEVGAVNVQGDTEVAAHYAMGRVAIGLAYVMPDQKTAYISDDGTNVGLYKFIADRKRRFFSGYPLCHEIESDQRRQRRKCRSGVDFSRPCDRC